MDNVGGFTHPPMEPSQQTWEFDVTKQKEVKTTVRGCSPWKTQNEDQGFVHRSIIPGVIAPCCYQQEVVSGTSSFLIDGASPQHLLGQEALIMSPLPSWCDHFLMALP